MRYLRTLYHSRFTGGTLSLDLLTVICALQSSGGRSEPSIMIITSLLLNRYYCAFSQAMLVLISKEIACELLYEKKSYLCLCPFKESIRTT